MYLKRNKIGKFWPIPKKGTKYVAVATHNKKESIPLIIVMRDILKITENKKELKRVINQKKILINHKVIREINFPVSLFDIISLPNFKKNYRAVFSAYRKIIFKEISDKEAETKIFKIIGKKTLKNKKIQLNFSQGRNIISSEKANVKDSAVINLKDDKIIRILALKKGANIFVLKGRHSGTKGKIEDIKLEGNKQIAEISKGKEKIKVWIKNLMVVE